MCSREREVKWREAGPLIPPYRGAVGSQGREEKWREAGPLVPPYRGAMGSQGREVKWREADPLVPPYRGDVSSWWREVELQLLKLSKQYPNDALVLESDLVRMDQYLWLGWCLDLPSLLPVF